MIVRVHPEALRNEGLPYAAAIWEDRYRSINEFEAHLERNGTHVVKIFLHLSAEEQRQRFLKRIDDPSHNWKFSMADIRERKFWKRYQEVFEACLTGTSTLGSPWYVVPADDKESARLIVSQIVLDALNGLKMVYPKLSKKQGLELKAIRKLLER